VTDYTNIDMIRSELESGLASGLTGALDTYTRANALAFRKIRPRADVLVAIGAATGYKRFFQLDGLSRFARWHFTVRFSVVTEADASGSFHEQVVGAIRSWAAVAAQDSWADVVNFPSHFIAEALRDSGSPSSIRGNDGVEKTMLTFAGQVGIRESVLAGN